MNEETREEILQFTKYLENLRNNIKKSVIQLCSEDSTDVSRAFYNLGLYTENLENNIQMNLRRCEVEEESDLEDEIGEREEEDQEMYKVFREVYKKYFNELLKGKCCGQKN
jgi:hypothetical protein